MPPALRSRPRPALLAVLLALGAAGPGCSAVRRSLAPRRRAEGAPVLQVRWRRQLTEPGPLEYKPQEFASAASSGQLVFIGSLGGWFDALRPEDGAIVWRKRIAAGVSGQPLYLPDTGTVFVGGDDGMLYALEAATGHERWSYRTRGPVDSTPVFEDGLIYFTTGENRIYALDAQSGAWRWQYDRESPESFTIRGLSSPLVVGGRAYVGFADGYLVALSARTGDALWARSLAADAQRFVDVDATPTLADGRLYASSYAGGVYALDPDGGAIRWRYEVEGAGTVRVDAGRVYFTSTKGGFYCLDTAGRVIWNQALPGKGELSPPLLVAGRYLVASASAAGTYVLRATDGHLLQFFDPGHGITAPPSTDGRRVYQLTNSGFLYAFGVL